MPRKLKPRDEAVEVVESTPESLRAEVDSEEGEDGSEEEVRGEFGGAVSEAPTGEGQVQAGEADDAPPDGVGEAPPERGPEVTGDLDQDADRMRRAIMEIQLLDSLEATYGPEIFWSAVFGTKPPDAPKQAPVDSARAYAGLPKGTLSPRL